MGNVRFHEARVSTSATGTARVSPVGTVPDERDQRRNHGPASETMA